MPLDLTTFHSSDAALTGSPCCLCAIHGKTRAVLQIMDAGKVIAVYCVFCLNDFLSKHLSQIHLVESQPNVLTSPKE